MNTRPVQHHQRDVAGERGEEGTEVQRPEKRLGPHLKETTACEEEADK